VFSVSAAYLYFAGYIFSYFYYFSHFGVTLESLDLSPQFYLMRAYTCFTSIGGLCLVIVFMLVITTYLRGKLRTSLMLLAMLAAFPLIFYVCYLTAQTEWKTTFCYPSSTIRFQFKEPAKKDSASAATPLAAIGDKSQSSGVIPDENSSPDLMALEQANELSLLLETKDRIVVFKKPNCYLLGAAGPMIPPAAHVFTLLRSDLKYSDVIP
jgi:hypothetical protein